MLIISYRSFAAALPKLVLAAAMLALTGVSGASKEAAARSVGDQRLEVVVPAGRGVLPFMADRAFDMAAPDATRVLITVHGAHRNVKGYFNAALRVVRQGNETTTMVVAPDFLLKEDIAEFVLPANTLFWTESGWKEGLNALGPAAISSYTALNTVLLHFANRRLYPALREIVLIGHSAGGQVVQRYAVTNQAEGALKQAGISVRYVVANPSSYLYFGMDRPGPLGTFRPADSAHCPTVNHWHYGFDHAPSFVGNRSSNALEQGYVARDVTYLLGLDDTHTDDALLDSSCGARTQGPYRLARGRSYFAYLRARHPVGLRHRVIMVPGIGHDERGLYTSACGMAVIFGRPIPGTCPHDPH